MRKLIHPWKTAAALGCAALLFGAGLLVGAAGAARPKTIVHVVQVKWKSDATEAQKKAAIDGVAKLAAQVPGIKNAWLKHTRKQPAYDFAWVFEFESQAAEQAYAKSAARAEWFEKVYNPIRESSLSNQFTND